MENKILLACVFSAMTFSSIAADTVNINVTGKVVASPCVTTNGDNNIAIDLSTLQASNLATAGAASTPVDFSIDFKDCPAGTSQVTATFSGTPDPDNDQYYKNAGTAQGVAVEIKEPKTDYNKGNGTSITEKVQADKTISIKMNARAVSVKGSATPGTISADIIATLQYN